MNSTGSPPTTSRIEAPSAALCSKSSAMSSHMDAALARINTLECALERARANLTRTKDYIGRGAYIYPGNVSRPVHDAIDEMAADAAKALG